MAAVPLPVDDVVTTITNETDAQGRISRIRIVSRIIATELGSLLIIVGIPDTAWPVTAFMFSRHPHLVPGSVENYLLEYAIEHEHELGVDIFHGMIYFMLDVPVGHQIPAVFNGEDGVITNIQNHQYTKDIILRFMARGMDFTQLRLESFQGLVGHIAVTMTFVQRLTSVLLPEAA